MWGLDGEVRVPTLREKRSGRAEMETQRVLRALQGTYIILFTINIYECVNIVS